MREQNVKETILEIAISTLDSSGESGIRVSQIVEQAGVTLPTLYHHFGNREGLIESAQVERFIRALREDVQGFIREVETCSTTGDLQKILANLIEALNLPNRAIMRWRRINAIGSTYARPHLAQMIVDAHDELVNQAALALLPLQRQGIIRRDIDLRAVVAWFNGAVVGKNLVEIAHSSIDVQQWDRTLLEATSALLFGSPHGHSDKPIHE